MGMEIYIDASGDPGLSARAIVAGVSSSYYCLGVIALRKTEASKMIEKARKEYFDIYGKRLPIEIKYVKARPEARKILVKHLCRNDIQKYVLSLNKLDKQTKTVSEFSEAGITPFVMQRNILGTMMEMLFQGDAILTSSDEKIDVYFDEGTHEQYAKVLERQVRRYKQEIRIHKPLKSANSPGIQLADILAGSYYHFELNPEKEKEPFEIIRSQCNVTEISLERHSKEYKLMHGKKIWIESR